MKPRILQIQILGLLLALAPPAAAQTGVLDVSWDASPDPGVVAYRVYFGTSSTSLDGMVEVPAPQTSTQLTGLLQFTFYFVEVTAVRSSGCESARSAQASGRTANPGPECTGVTLDTTLVQGAVGRGLTIAGTGFEPGISVAFVDPPRDSVLLGITSQTLNGTTQIRLAVDAAPDAPVGPVSVELTNTDPTQASATCVDAFSIGFDRDRADVDGSGRVDGLDTTLLSIVFGSFLQVCSLDSPNAAARGSFCDSEDDCGGTVGVTGFCTGRACDAASPSNGGLACNSEDDCGGGGGSALCAASPYNPAADLDASGLIDGDDMSLQGPEFGKAVP